MEVKEMFDPKDIHVAASTKDHQLIILFDHKNMYIIDNHNHGQTGDPIITKDKIYKKENLFVKGI